MKRLAFLFAALSLMLWAASAEGQSLSFYQMDFNLAGNVVNDSDWGAVDFTYQGQDPLMYFNLAVNGSWQVQNVPVLSQEGVGVDQTMRYYFSLDVPRGTDVSTINYAYSFTSAIAAGTPSGATATAVGNDTFSQGPGFLGGGPSDLAPAVPLVGGEVSKGMDGIYRITSVSGMPNNEASSNGCAPTAFANSLQFLNAKKGLNLQPDQVSVSKLEQVVGYNPETQTISDDWYALKSKYAADLGVTTRKVYDILSLAKELDATQDVELVYSFVQGTDTTVHVHMTVMTGMILYMDGKYGIIEKDDGDQGKPGGTNTTYWTYDPNTGVMYTTYGSVRLDYAVVECPEPATAAFVALGITALVAIRQRRILPRRS